MPIGAEVGDGCPFCRVYLTTRLLLLLNGKLKVVPAGTVDVTVRLPPCASIIEGVTSKFVVQRKYQPAGVEALRQLVALPGAQ